VDDAVVWAIRAVGPALVCVLIGAVLSLRKARYHLTSRWGIRLSVLGIGLGFVVPGVLILVDTIRGQLMRPAAFAGIVSIWLGLVFLAILRQNWAPRATDSN